MLLFPPALPDEQKEQRELSIDTVQRFLIDSWLVGPTRWSRNLVIKSEFLILEDHTRSDAQDMRQSLPSGRV